YQRVRTPHIARGRLYITSGHLPYYEESMFPPMFLEKESEGEEVLRLDRDIERALKPFEDRRANDNVLDTAIWEIEDAMEHGQPLSPLISPDRLKTLPTEFANIFQRFKHRDALQMA